MATQNTTAADGKQQVSVPIIIIAIVVLVLIIGVMARHFLTPPPSNIAQGLELDKKPLPSWIMQDAKQSQGDFSKLDLKEQQKIQTAYHGTGPTVLRAAYAAQSQ